MREHAIIIKEIIFQSSLTEERSLRNDHQNEINMKQSAHVDHLLKSQAFWHSSGFSQIPERHHLASLFSPTLLASFMTAKHLHGLFLARSEARMALMMSQGTKIYFQQHQLIPFNIVCCFSKYLTRTKVSQKFYGSSARNILNDHKNREESNKRQ